MASTNKISYAVSVTPKIETTESDGNYQAFTAIHESVRKSLGGSGEITGTDSDVAGFADGVAATVSSSGGTVMAHGAATECIFIKNLGTLVADDTAAAAADTVLVKQATAVIATLGLGGALVLPKPSGAVLTLASGSAAVNVEVCVIGSAA